MHMSTGHAASQHSRVGQQMHITATQAAQLSAAQARASHQQHDEAVASRAARRDQCHDLAVAGPIHPRIGLVQPVPGTHPPRHRRVLTASLLG
jgi:hypothetical protein